MKDILTGIPYLLSGKTVPIMYDRPETSPPVTFGQIMEVVAADNPFTPSNRLEERAVLLPDTLKRIFKQYFVLGNIPNITVDQQIKLLGVDAARRLPANIRVPLDFDSTIQRRLEVSGDFVIIESADPENDTFHKIRYEKPGEINGIPIFTVCEVYKAEKVAESNSIGIMNATVALYPDFFSIDAFGDGNWLGDESNNRFPNEVSIRRPYYKQENPNVTDQRGEVF